MSCLNSQKLPELVVFGEALTDFIIQDHGCYDARPGGACWNVARVTARLGVSTGYAGSVSTDLFGTELYNLAIEAGCDERFIQCYDQSPFLAMVTERDPPNYFFIGNNSADLSFDRKQLPHDWMNYAKWIHFGCISLVRNPLADQLMHIAEEAHNRGIKISYDPNWRNLMKNDHAYYERFKKLSSLASLIKVSDEDLTHLFNEEMNENLIIKMQRLAPHADILYTLGAHGMKLILKTGEVFTKPIIPIKVQDSVGAGDAAIGGFLSSLIIHPNNAFIDHLSFSVASASYTCQKSGAYAPTYDEVSQFLLLNQETH